MFKGLTRMAMVAVCAAVCGGTAYGAEKDGRAGAVATPAGSAVVQTAAAILKPTGPKSYPDPARWEKSIAAFEAADKTAGTPAPGGVVCIGSSSMVFWQKSSIVKDLAPLNVIPRGFGGSMMNDAAYYAERMVVRYRPKAVVLYEGDNDIGSGMAPKQVCEAFEKFVGTVRKALPETRIYVLSIKPSIKRWSLWPVTQEANRLIAGACAKDPKHLTYVSVYEGMLGPDGKPRADIFRTDNLHMNAKGYEIWTKVVRAAVVAKETVVKEATAAVAPVTTKAN